MPIYDAPTRDMQFLLHDCFDLQKYSNLPGFADATPDVIAWADPGIVFFGARTDGCGGLRSPPRFDLGGARRLASIASVRLIL